MAFATPEAAYPRILFFYLPQLLVEVAQSASRQEALDFSRPTTPCSLLAIAATASSCFA